MKTKSKALLLTLCAVLLVAASVLGTMAYLTDNDTVTNTFTVGNVKLGSDSEAGLDEAKTNTDGQPMKKSDDGNDTWEVVNDVKDATRVKANTYKLVPGHTYVKDPTIHVGDDSDACYLFVKVENGISAIEATGDTTIAKQMETLGWKALGEGYANIYVYVGTDEGATNPKAVEAKTDVVVFEQFKVKDDATNTGLEAVKDANITVTAYAVQTDGFTDKTATEIWNAAFATTTSGSTPGGSTTGGSEAGDGGIAGA